MNDQIQSALDWLSGAPLRIIAVLTGAVIAQWLGHRAINRAVNRLATVDLRPGPGTAHRQAERAQPGGGQRPDPPSPGLQRHEPGSGAYGGPPGPGRSENVPGQAPQERLDRLAPLGPEERTPWRTLPVMENSCRAIKREPGKRL